MPKKTVYLLTSLWLATSYPLILAEDDEDDEETQDDGPVEKKADHWQSYTPLPDKFQPAKEVTTEVSVKDIIDSPEDYTYASFGKPNPFVPPPPRVTNLEIPIVSILQKYSLEKLQVVGIWVLGNKERKALIMSPEDEGVIVGLGDPAGNRGGKVISIDSNVVKVREFTIAPDGSRQFEDYEIWLGDEQPQQQEKIIITSRDNAANSQGYIERSESQQTRTRQILDKAANKSGPEMISPNPPPKSLHRKPREAKPDAGPANNAKDKGELDVETPANPTAEGL